MIVWTATPRARHVASNASTSAAYAGWASIGKLVLLLALASPAVRATPLSTPNELP